MATIIFDNTAKSEWDTVTSSAAVKTILGGGDKASPKGSKTIDSVLGDAIRLLSDISADSNALVNRFAEVDMGTLGSVEYNNLINYLRTSTGTLTAEEIMAYAINIESCLVEHLLHVYASDDMPTGFKTRAKECAKDLVRKVAIDYRNLCILMNDAASPVFAQEVPTISGKTIDIMKMAPTDRNFYQVYTYVNANKDSIIFNAETKYALDDADIAAKNLPKDSVKNVFVKTANFGRRVAPGSDLGDDYKTLFGGLTTTDKRAIKGTAAATAIVTVALVTLLAAKSCQAGQKGPEKLPEEEYTMGEKDTEINNPVVDFEIPETEAGTDEEGNTMPEPEDTRDYSEPSTGRNPDKGSTDDFVLPGIGEDQTEEIQQPQDTESIENPAEGAESPDHEGRGPNRGGSSEEETEDDGFISDRY